MHDIEAKIVDEIADAYRYHDWLVRCDAAQRSPIKMVEVCMSHEDQIDIRQMMNLKARLFQPLDDFEPACPVWIDEHVVIVRLNKKGRVSDPGDGVFSWSNLWESGC